VTSAVDDGSDSDASATPSPAGRREPLRVRVRGPWRVAVVEHSMRPAIEAGDWLLVDPTVRTWPRRGAIVVFREPDSDALAVKRVVGRPGDRVPFAGGFLHLAADEAWLLGDADEDSRDSRAYGPVTVEMLVGRAWFRYAPRSRFGRLRGSTADR
jgi:signal peptidase I